MHTPIVIGLTGSFGAGCSTIVRHLKDEYGFKRFSLGDKVRQAAIDDGDGPFDEPLSSEQRKLLQDCGDRLRREGGPAYLADQCILELDELRSTTKNEAAEFVIDSIRHPAEVEAFRAVFPRFYLVAVYAPQDVRWQRSKAAFHSNEGEFEAQDERDKGENQPPCGQNVQGCVDQADVLISNARACQAPGEWESLWQKIGELVELVREPGSSDPDYDELYMGQAYASSLMSTCYKRKVGAVIVQGIIPERRRTKPQAEKSTRAVGAGEPFPAVVATGWNEVPPGTRSCRDRGGRGRDGRWLGYCEKDVAVLAAMKDMRYCPGCGGKLRIPEDATSSFCCPKCSTQVGKKYAAGRQLDLCIAVHAEEAAILQAARLGGTSLEGATLYTTTFPCLLCAKKIMQVGIKEVVFAEPYPMPESVKLLADAGIEVRQFSGVTARSYFRLYNDSQRR